jgi:uncharacterized protein YceK
MVNRASPLLAQMLVIAACGCGTTFDGIVRDYNQGHGSGPQVYGGVRHDLSVLSQFPVAMYEAEHTQDKAIMILCGGLWVADLPISAAADTVLLPISLPNSLAHRQADSTEPYTGRENSRYGHRVELHDGTVIPPFNANPPDSSAERSSSR